MCGTKQSGVELTSFCLSVLGTNKNETSFGLEMSQTGFSSHVVEVQTCSEPSCHTLSTLGRHPAFLGCLLFLFLSFLGFSASRLLWLEEGSQGLQLISCLTLPDQGADGDVSPWTKGPV